MYQWKKETSKKGPFLSKGMYALWQENGCIEKIFMHLKLTRASPGSSLVINKGPNFNLMQFSFDSSFILTPKSLVIGRLGGPEA